MKRRLIFEAVFFLFSLCLFACKVVAENDLVDYVARRGLEDNDRQLAPVQADIREILPTGKTREIWKLEDGAEYLDKAQEVQSYTVTLYAPQNTVAGLHTFTELPPVDFEVLYCAPGKNIFASLYKSEEEYGTVHLADGNVVIEGLQPGRYLIKARATLEDYIDSEIGVWNFVVGKELGVRLSIVQDGNYAFDLVLETTTFTRADFGNDHIVRLYLKMYKVELDKSLTPMEIPEDFEPPTFTLRDSETPIPLALYDAVIATNRTSALYYYDLGADKTPAEPVEYGVRLALGYGNTLMCEPELDTPISIK